MAPFGKQFWHPWEAYRTNGLYFPLSSVEAATTLPSILILYLNLYLAILHFMQTLIFTLIFIYIFFFFKYGRYNWFIVPFFFIQYTQLLFNLVYFVRIISQHEFFFYIVHFNKLFQFSLNSSKSKTNSLTGKHFLQKKMAVFIVSYPLIFFKCI